MAVWILLTGKLQGLHPVFHISLFCRYKPFGDGVEPLPSIVADEAEEYKVKALFSHLFQLGTRQYLVY